MGKIARSNASITTGQILVSIHNSQMQNNAPKQSELGRLRGTYLNLCKGAMCSLGVVAVGFATHHGQITATAVPAQTPKCTPYTVGLYRLSMSRSLLSI